MRSFAALAGLLALLPSALAVSEWGQCGGLYYFGSTQCDSGLTCVYSNDWYSQCLRVTTTSSTRSSTTSTRTSTSTSKSTSTSTSTRSSSTSTSTTTRSSSTSTSVCATPTATGFKYFGVSESCAEFGDGKVPGILNTDYTWPSPSSIDFFVGKGFNTFRIPFMMERLSPPSTGLTGPFDATYLSGLKTIVSYVTSKGAYAAIDPHNYARYNGAIITDYNAFQTWWQNLASQFAGNNLVIFDINNEPNGITGTDAATLMQAGINGVRASGATNTIFVEGTSWTGAWSWTTSGNSDAFTSINDPLSNTIIEMHQYLDSDGSGTNATCVSSTVGAERLTAATQWLQAHGFKAILGEFGGGSNDVCIAAIKGALQYMQDSGVWVGALWWAAGPWWGTYFQSIEPPSGPAVARILPEALLPFVPGSSSSGPSCSTSIVTSTTSTTRSLFTSTSTSTSTSTRSTSTSTSTSTRSSTSTRTSTTQVNPSGCSGNPYLGWDVWRSTYYASEVYAAAAQVTDAALKAKISKVADVPTFTWFDTMAKVADLPGYLSAAAGQILQIVVYDLPNRDCHANASNGELTYANNGAALYQQYIDGIASGVAGAGSTRVVAVVEPDSLANLVTNLSDQRCSSVQTQYKASVTYALQKLSAVGVYLYMDAGHAGWLGWTSNLAPAAQLFAQMYTSGGKSACIRGLATDVANYNALTTNSPDPITQGDPCYDELLYIQALAPQLSNNGWSSARFIVDQGRSGVQNIRTQWGDWCNIKGAGFGMRPTTNTPDPLIDAIVWVKPGGECDGTSNQSAARFDSTCALSDAKQPAPEAGTWFQAYFIDLVNNANPSF